MVVVLRRTLHIPRSDVGCIRTKFAHRIHCSVPGCEHVWPSRQHRCVRNAEWYLLGTMVPLGKLSRRSPRKTCRRCPLGFYTRGSTVNGLGRDSMWGTNGKWRFRSGVVVLCFALLIGMLWLRSEFVIDSITAKSESTSVDYFISYPGRLAWIRNHYASVDAIRYKSTEYRFESTPRHRDEESLLNPFKPVPIHGAAKVIWSSPPHWVIAAPLGLLAAFLLLGGRRRQAGVIPQQPLTPSAPQQLEQVLPTPAQSPEPKTDSSPAH